MELSYIFSKKFILYFRKGNLKAQRFKNFSYFSERKMFLIFREEVPSLKNLLYFPSENLFLYFGMELFSCKPKK